MIMTDRNFLKDCKNKRMSPTYSYQQRVLQFYKHDVLPKKNVSILRTKLAFVVKDFTIFHFSFKTTYKYNNIQLAIHFRIKINAAHP